MLTEGFLVRVQAEEPILQCLVSTTPGSICFRKARPPPESGLAIFEQISQLVVPVDRSIYGDYEHLARERIETRDPDDWPAVAVALMLDLPIWTEDQDLFGSGTATWTTDRVEVCLKAGQGP
ncbi:MAG TPA: PIN domain-containing protein [Terriglobia bacterium]|nr:PIN domain-containing protein [Terriglobia bacterium]